mmetsp:Transcript_36574/g.89048  ORF Transcript_36574/g.89048 Transcript_36574/m.89048 type:complete len:287 (-) Transcript_36574:177-1037(-)
MCDDSASCPDWLSIWPSWRPSWYSCRWLLSSADPEHCPSKLGPSPAAEAICALVGELESASIAPRMASTMPSSSEMPSAPSRSRISFSCPACSTSFCRSAASFLSFIISKFGIESPLPPPATWRSCAERSCFSRASSRLTSHRLTHSVNERCDELFLLIARGQVPPAPCGISSSIPEQSDSVKVRFIPEHDDSDCPPSESVSECALGQPLPPLPCQGVLRYARRRCPRCCHVAARARRSWRASCIAAAVGSFSVVETLSEEDDVERRTVEREGSVRQPAAPRPSAP